MSIVMQGWDGKYILVHEKTKRPVELDEEIQYHDKTLRCEGGKPPHKAGSTGRIWMREVGEPRYDHNEWFPNVCDMHWMPYQRII